MKIKQTNNQFFNGVRMRRVIYGHESQTSLILERYEEERKLLSFGVSYSITPLQKLKRELRWNLKVEN